MVDNPSVTILVMVEAGSKYEDKRINGLSHFLEHMVFKGTVKRPKANIISRELDSIGAHCNAFTAQEFTGYYVKADTRHIGVARDVVSDIYLNGLFDPSEIEKEKGVIIEEIRMYRDMPHQHVHDLFLELVYGDQAVGRNIAGTEETVRSFTQADLLAYRRAHYVAEATAVIVAGSFKEDEIIDKINKVFGTIPVSPKQHKAPVIDTQDRPFIRTIVRQTDQTHLVIGVRAFQVDDKRVPTMRVLSTILGKGMSSRLFSKMRDELGICYYIKTDYSPFTDHGILTISAGVPHNRFEEAVKGIIIECSRLKSDMVSDTELRKAKDYIAGTILLELETSDARAEFAGHEEILKKSILSPDDIIAKTNAVTVSDLMDLANELFVNQGLNLAAIGPFKNDQIVMPYVRFD